MQLKDYITYDSALKVCGVLSVKSGVGPAVDQTRRRSEI